MTNFRNKIAVILVDSELNDDNIKNCDLETDDGNTDPMDCVIVDGPSKNIETSQSLVFFFLYQSQTNTAGFNR